MTGTELRRPLSPVERWYWIADQLSPLNVVARVRVHAALPADRLARAAAALTAEYPALRAAVAADTDGANPVFTASTRTRTIRRCRGTETDWPGEVDTELATALDTRTGPLLRIVDIAGEHGHDVLLTVAHLVADGTTALTLLRKLIEYAWDPPDPVVARPAIPAPEDLLPARHRGARGLAAIAATGLADRAATAVARPRRLTPETPVPAGRRRTRFLPRGLDAEQLRTLVRRCRAERVTVHGALAAALAMAVGPAVAQRESGRVCIGSPIDFRAELVPPVPYDEVGAYVSTVPTLVGFGDGDLWSVARAVNRGLTRRRRFGQHLALLAALRFVCPASVSTSARVVGLIERGGPGNICLSNIGRYDFPDRIGDWSLSGAQFIAGISVSGYFVATVNTSHDRLSWNFTYIDGAVAAASARRYADDAVRILLHALDEVPR